MRDETCPPHQTTAVAGDALKCLVHGWSVAALMCIQVSQHSSSIREEALSTEHALFTKRAQVLVIGAPVRKRNGALATSLA